MGGVVLGRLQTAIARRHPAPCSASGPLHERTLLLPAHTLPHQKLRMDRDCSDVWCGVWACGCAAGPRPAWHGHGASRARRRGGRRRLPSCGGSDPACGSGADSDPAPETRTRRGGFHSLRLAGCSAPLRCARVALAAACRPASAWLLARSPRFTLHNKGICTCCCVQRC